MKGENTMEDEKIIRKLQVALSIAALYAHNNLPAYVPEDIPFEEAIYLYSDDDIFGDRFIAYWLKQAEEEISKYDNKERKEKDVTETTH